MTRKRMTLIFPFLLPLRKRQRTFCFYMRMRLDKNKYSDSFSKTILPYKVFETSSPLYNQNTGFDMVYQENKVFNLKLAAKTLNGLFIKPGETFSFWQLVRNAEQTVRFKDGLSVENGKLTTVKGGGLCHLSNFLFWMFLHSPLKIVERHPHRIKGFPSPGGNEPDGVDATVSEGWLDLKMKNETDWTFQIDLSFEGSVLYGRLLTDQTMPCRYEITNRDKLFFRQDKKIYEQVVVCRQCIDYKSGETHPEQLLYTDVFEIGYSLPEETEIISKDHAMDKKTVAVLFGGCSTEYEVSLQSAASVIQSISTDKYEIVLLGITREGVWKRYAGPVEWISNDTWADHPSCVPAFISPDRAMRGLLALEDGKAVVIPVDVAFPVLHGKNGEDGTVQGLLELAGISCVGCGTLSSAICMDKDIAHRLVELAGISVPQSVVIDSPAAANALLNATAHLRYPLFVKPVCAGSSFGITKVSGPDGLSDAVKAAFEHDRKVVIEQGVEGFEVGCAVLGNDELIVGEVDEIELSRGFFDYTEKYTLKSSSIHMPARIDPNTAMRIKHTAKAIYKVLGCRGFARVDMFLTPESEIVFNEVNTIPGFTSHSRYPGMLKGIGMSFEVIVDTLIRLAVEL